MMKDNKKKSSTRELFIKRTKYLISTNYRELNDEDRIHSILMKITLEPQEYQLLKLWCVSKWSIDKTSKLMAQSKREVENQISKIITKLKPLVWNYKNTPFIKDEDREKQINKNIWIGDVVIEKFLNTDLVIMSVNEYLDTVINS